MIGTETLDIRQGDILFIEDIDEMLYHLDRMLLHMDRAGILARISGLCVGGLTDMRDNTLDFGFSSDNPYGSSAEQIVAERVAKYDFPVLFDLPCGHGKRNAPLLFGSSISIAVNSEGGELGPLRQGE